MIYTYEKSGKLVYSIDDGTTLWAIFNGIFNKTVHVDITFYLLRTLNAASRAENFTLLLTQNRHFQLQEFDFSTAQIHFRTAYFV